MIKAFAYLRVSTIGQIEGDGLPRQRAAIEAYSAANGIEIVGWFEEKGISGKTDWEDRPAWSDMIGQLNGVRTIVIERLDRLARELFVQEYILRDLVKRDVKLVTSASEDTSDEDPTRVLFRQILGSIAQYDRTMIVRKLKSARDRMKRDTGRCEGRKGYGRTSDELDVIERMEGWRNAGVPFDTIAQRLNDAGVSAPCRKRNTIWYGCTVNRILNRRVKSAPTGDAEPLDGPA